ncbi:trimeric intracellular cation channel family protein [Microbacterium kribbense]|uniref:Trimeric intracellular cation channel family protein n=1 Tax=Microbacterium kribbense TaxID=433645 RepID=A0ABP7GQZ9_9MICO
MTWSLALDLLGTFFFAISGSLLAAQRGFDIVGSLLLGSLTGLGGGVIRDLVIGAPPAAFNEPFHLIPPVVAAIVVFFLSGTVQRYSRILLVFDAGGLALFCTTGTITALRAGMNPAAAIVLGVTTGVGGGLLRDVVANRDPQLFNPNDLYAVPAFFGAALMAGLWFTGWLGPSGQLVVAVLVFAFRVLSLRFHWHIVHAQGSQSRHSSDGVS